MDGIKNKKQKIQIAILLEGFITASLIFVIGSMGIIGALDSGLRNDHAVLITKGIIDGFTSIILTSTLGIGVLLSAFPVLIYQGMIAIFSGLISKYIPEEAIESLYPRNDSNWRRYDISDWFKYCRIN